MGQLQGSYLAVNQTMAVNDYLCSPNRTFFALMQSNGSFCIYKGSSPQHNQALVWATLKCGTVEAAQVGQFFAVLQSDGNFCVYQGSGPNDNQGAVWCKMVVGDGGQFFAAMQDDGNFCVYMGTGPDDNRGLLWDTFSYPMNPRQYNLRMNDVEVAFNAVSKKGNNHSFTGGPKLDIIESHVQGIADYQDYFILTHSDDGDDHGYLIVLDNKDKNLAYVFNTEDTGYTHPGGCQRIGSILAVPIENLSSHKSIIRFYNLTGMTDSDQHKPQLMDLKIERPTKKAGGIGITSRMAADGLEYHYLAVSFGGDKKIDFYKSNGRPLTDAACSFTLISTVTLDKSGYSEICLITESNNYQWIYLVGFRVEEEKIDLPPIVGSGTVGYAYKDYVDLYRVFPEDYNAELVKTRHVVTDYGNGVSGIAGVHFRWGAGLKIMSETKMKFFATQRNFVANHLYTNTFS